MAGQTECGLKDCKRSLKNGARIGYSFENQLGEVIVCEFHTRMALSGLYAVDKTAKGDLVLKAIPSKKIIT